MGWKVYGVPATALVGGIPEIVGGGARPDGCRQHLHRERGQARALVAVAHRDHDVGVAADARSRGRARELSGRGVEARPRRPVADRKHQRAALRVGRTRREAVGLPRGDTRRRRAGDRDMVVMVVPAVPVARMGRDADRRPEDGRQNDDENTSQREVRAKVCFFHVPPRSVRSHVGRQSPTRSARQRAARGSSRLTTVRCVSRTGRQPRCLPWRRPEALRPRLATGLPLLECTVRAADLLSKCLDIATSESGDSPRHRCAPVCAARTQCAHCTLMLTTFDMALFMPLLV